ncbi:MULTISPECIES: dTMP kinase [Holospora]|uniref:Thymidylate kinase n=2 Tax=Holospora TaxID=44747 RepID=A0A061JG00_9PROT|nr:MULTISPECIES: dTMP kinase [Holospora]ETZ04690.1 thymidylate kinase [Holospora undulata HU1]GAJ46230.1 thymidylate kinase [Holospora elegans E1]
MNVKKFITFEGGDGAGKSVQIQKLYHRLKQEHGPVYVTREPGGTALGETLRTMILRTPDLAPKSLCALFIAARHHHWAQVIAPALAQGFWVLCDRFIHSTFVYQGGIGGLDFEFIQLLHEQLEAYIIPGLTFVLQSVPTESYARCQRRDSSQKNYLDQRNFSIHCAVEKAYNDLSLGNIVRIAPGNLKETEESVWKSFQHYLLKECSE